MHEKLFDQVTPKFISSNATHELSTTERLYNSMFDLASKLSNRDRVGSDDYKSLCVQLNYLFLNMQKDNQVFILEEKGQQAIEYLLSILNQQKMKIPPRYVAQEDHTFFYFYLLKSWLKFTKNNFSKATQLLEIAKTFPQETQSAETDDLEDLADNQIQLQKSIEQSFMQQHKQTTGITTQLSEDVFKALVNKYQSNKKQLLINSSDETLARYFIDPKHQTAESNPIAAWNKKEPGSVLAMIKMIRAMFDKDEELSVDFIKEMHKLALDGVTLPRANRRLPITPGAFRQEPVKFNLLAKNANSLAGFYNIADWVEEQKIKNKHRYEIIISKSLSAITLHIQTTLSNIEEKLPELIADYRTSIATATSTREIIKACATFSHCFSLVHPFSDGNLRLSQQLLNFLLAKNNLPLCILSEPSLIEGVSPDELVDHIVIGFHNFQHLMTEGYVPGTPVEFDSKEINQPRAANNLMFKSMEAQKPDMQQSLTPLKLG